MFNEYKFQMDNRVQLEDLALQEEQLAKVLGGHHEPLARMIRKAAAKAPRQQLSLFPGSSRPKEAL
jgi:hypothetical protein